ncbi:MAG: hypothetical protein KDC38_05150 [Planctomycetes bacterium]|nr:hypothetical protein [Planctomycetota bacterium]
MRCPALSVISGHDGGVGGADRFGGLLGIDPDNTSAGGARTGSAPSTGSPTEAVSIDDRLVGHEVHVAAAHAQMLYERGYLERGEFEVLTRALWVIADEHRRGQWRVASRGATAQSVIDAELHRLVGEVARKTRLGCSPVDRATAAVRLCAIEAIHDLRELGESLLGELDALIAEQGEIPLSVTSGSRRRLPASVALWAHAYHAELSDDLRRLETATERVSLNPLGSASAYGMAVVDVDRDRLSELLGFAADEEAMTVAPFARGKPEAGLLFEIVLLDLDLGRLADDLIAFASVDPRFEGPTPEGHRIGETWASICDRAAMASGELQISLGLVGRSSTGSPEEVRHLADPLFRTIDSTARNITLLVESIPRVRFDAIV